ncbi:BTB and MATH domain-containing protein 43 [Halotydeus destructor]|nr:BTB and MATH domain-containing protein 43 [Halotydeus destructor]
MAAIAGQGTPNNNVPAVQGSATVVGSLLKANSHSVSELTMTKFSHLWTIKQFPLIPVEPVDRLCSPHFSPPNNPKDLWFLKLRLRAVEEVDDQVVSQEYIGVHLFLRESGDKKKEVRAHYTISVLDAMGNKRYTGECSKPEGRVFKSGTEGHGYKLLCPRENILRSENRLLGEDQSLNIRVEVTVFGEVKAHNPSLDPKYRPYVEKDLNRYGVASGFASLFEKKKLCDFTIVSKGDIKIPCHKAVLIARSDVFEVMIADHPTLEKINNEVKLDDIDETVIKEMLKFIYTDKIPKMSEFAYDLLIVADRFNLQRLKMECEDHLIENLKSPDIGKILACADMANAKKLKMAALEYTATNPDEVSTSEGWTKHLFKRPLLFKEAFDILAKKQRKS